MIRTFKVWESVMLLSLEKEIKRSKKKEEKEKEMESNLVHFPQKNKEGVVSFLATMRKQHFFH